MKIKRVCVLASNYPTPSKPYQHTFIHEFVSKFPDYDIEVVVICPQNILKKDKNTPKSWMKKTTTGKSIRILMPDFLSVTNKKKGPINFAALTLKSYTLIANREIKKLISQGWKPDIIYAHFLYTPGLAAAEIGRKLSIPVFCAVGEGRSWSIQALGPKVTRSRLESVSGFIAVSQWVKEMLLRYEITSPDKITVIPNGVNLKKFHPLNKKVAREKYGLTNDSFVVAFVGRFENEKGVLRVSEAIKDIKDAKGIFIGKGEQVPIGEHVFFNGTVAHDELTEYLSLADVFVLPTLVEGCSNAIIEAMACGLPIISSTGSFNDDILDESCSIRINPMDINKIRDSIRIFSDNNEKIIDMSASAVSKAQEFDINKRVLKVIKLMEGTINNFKSDG